MTSTISFLATDLDGTFLDSRGVVSSENKKALHLAEKQGLSVVFVTGRPARWIRGVVEAAEHHSLVVGANGGFIADATSMTVVQTNPIPHDKAAQAIEKVLERIPDATFGVERSFIGMPLAESHALRYDEMRITTLSDHEFSMTPGYAPSWKTEPTIPIAPITELIQLPDITKIIIKPADPTGWTSDSWLQHIEPLVSDVVQATHASENVVLAEISALGINKGFAVQQLAQQYELQPTQMAAVGDMPNDIPMLEWVAEPWAVANAHPEVLAATANHLPHHDESAVAHLIHDLLSR